MSLAEPIDVIGWSIEDHLRARREGLTAVAAIRATLDALRMESLTNPILIGEPLDDLALDLAASLDRRGTAGLALHGIPFVVKDNIDVAGTPTTCANPSFDRMPSEHAAVVAALVAAGAVPVAKTNMDQFATGLVGTRSPFGPPHNPLNPTLVPGGSSSGSAVVVALGLVPFSLGTDTAGSGRVPASMCGIVGLKPTIGRFSSLGVVPAVRRIDCVSVFARTVGEARLVANHAESFVADDPYSRRRHEATCAIRVLGVAAPAALADLMADDAIQAYIETVEKARACGFEIREVDIEPLLATGRLLYGGALVAERTAAVGDALDTPHVDPFVRSIIESGRGKTAVEAYRGEYALAEMRVACDRALLGTDAMLLPTTPFAATLHDLATDPIGANARIGTFTTFVNLLDHAAFAVPVGRRRDALPCGVQISGPAWSDEALADVAAVLLAEPIPAGLRTGEQAVVVVGAHLSGMPLNGQLIDRGGRQVAAANTAAIYRLYALAGTVPPKPGLRRVGIGETGASIEVEVWALPPTGFASFVTAIPAPLGIGSIELADGSRLPGFICEPIGLIDAIDITSFGGWRAYQAASTA